jgi:uncharacterized protein (UPF0332 family)
VSQSAEIQANLERSQASLQAARILLSSNLPNDAVSRAYYAVFHAASALLLSENLSFSSHTGVLRAISLNFVKTGRLAKNYGRDLNWLAELRQVADYGETKSISLSEAEKALNAAEQFINLANQLLG